MSTPPSPRAPKRLQRRAVRGLAALLALIGNLGAGICASHAALTSRPAFFASPRACAASKLFSKQECDDGFGDALAEIRARGLTFVSQFECVARFQLCERVGLGAEADSKHAFTPTLLGIEIARGPGGRLSKPVFAVETSPELFPPKPIVSAVPPAPEALGAWESVQKVRRPSAELPVDHFELVEFLGNQEALGALSTQSGGSAHRSRHNGIEVARNGATAARTSAKRALHRVIGAPGALKPLSGSRRDET